MIYKQSVLIAVPVLNGGLVWKNSIKRLLEYKDTYDFLIIDSGSTDESLKNSSRLTSNILSINKHDFGHGRTRNIALDIARRNKHDYILFLTQDSILDTGAADRLVESFQADSQIAAVYGRQLPHENATAIAKHARHYNYPSCSRLNSRETIMQHGIKTVFMSNSFAAYRVDALHGIGGFPANTILCEDMYVAGKLIMRSFKTYYSANAICKHSHNYSAKDEFRRYFDIGVFYKTEPWIKEYFGGKNKEGYNFLISEFQFLMNERPICIPQSLLNNAAKFLGVLLGSYHRFIPTKVKRITSMHKGFWSDAKIYKE
jgi:rhamnosyltransferase